ncbi:MAG: hypothetical protein EB066_09135, partial [Betaproteobacteria bacterium]|nr:hypothetical protein [Betaproteobacteria bacterium]
SLERLANAGGRIGPKKIRLHQWLRENGVELVRPATTGSNLTGQVSQVKLTELALMTNQLEVNIDAMRPELSEREIAAYLTGDTQANAALCALLYPDAESLTDEEAIREIFDFLPVDSRSLTNYIEWLTTEATKIPADRKATALHQARLVLGVAAHYDGWYLQRKKPSEFGRVYYEGVSVQNVNRELRRAILGDCWEYDIRSSVITWKMGFARDYLTSIGQTGDDAVRRTFLSTLCYIEDRKDFMVTVRRSVFTDPDEPTDAEFQTKLIKQAITAISFGARATSTGWPNGSGGITNSAIVDILRNPNQRRRFLADIVVVGFIREQNCLDDYIFGLVKTRFPELLTMESLQTPSGRPNKSRVLAFLYQHAETEVMSIVTQAAAKHGRQPIARVHDAIFFRKRLSLDLKLEIEDEMQGQTNNPYWRLTAKALEGYRSLYRDQIREEREHRARIAEETRRAENYQSQFAEMDHADDSYDSDDW